jgi:parallel beta helix pectate lyase-like protein
MRRLPLLAFAVIAAMLVPTGALAHFERPTLSPARPGKVPDINRTPTEIINVCKIAAECSFEHIQAAVDAADDGALIQIWPGRYNEEPSVASPDLPPDTPQGWYTYEFHAAHPNAQNLIAVVGKHNITLRGMGSSPRDVVIDARFKKHVGIRGDRADGLIIQNLSTWHANEHGIYILDQDGFIIDNVDSGYSGEYSFLTFATDHGVYRHCEAFGSGDAGIYPGGSADTEGRWSTEIDHCKAYHNVNGYSGTQGDHVWVHDSEFYDNGIGIVSDSETDHPNYPENNLIVERTKIYGNNFNYYDPSSDVAPVEFDEAGAGLNGVALPPGIGIFLASGNDNLVQNNDIWDNGRYGVWLASGEGMVVGPTSEPMGQFFMSSGNRFINNRMFAAGTDPKNNKTDFGWDGFGQNNCWDGNTRSASGDPATSDAPFLPPCSTPLGAAPLPVGVPWVPNSLEQLSVAKYNGRPLCDYIGYQPCVFGPGPAEGKARNRPDGMQTPPAPPPCGPETPCAAGASASSVSVRGAKTSRTFHATAQPVGLPATGVATPTGLAIMLIVGAAVIGTTAVVTRLRNRRTG